MTDSDFAWLVEHGNELSEKYAGKWIAVRDGEIVGVGDTAPEAAQRAKETDPDADFLLEAIEGEADVIYGGL